MTEAKKQANRDKQKRLYKKRKAEGRGNPVTIYLSDDQIRDLRFFYDTAYNGGNTFAEFKVLALMRGGVFVANTGKGRRIKKTKDGYKLTE